MPIGLNNFNYAQSSDGLGNALYKNYQRLSSGRRINSAADDAAGAAISANLEALTRSLSVAERNTTGGISLASVREGALSSVGDITTRMRELAVQAADGSLSATDRGYLDTEFQQLKEEVGRLSGSTSYNGTQVLGGSETDVSIQVGAGSSSNDQLSVKTGGIDTTTLGIDGLSLAGANGSNALAAIDAIDGAATAVNTARAENGATMNRLADAQRSTLDRRTSLVAANSQISDSDFAQETSDLAKNQILQQARISVILQANNGASLALNLLNR
jgi:flagellin